MKSVLIHTLYIVVILGLLFVNVHQGVVINQQSLLVRDMIKNPYCLIPR